MTLNNAVTIESILEKAKRKGNKQYGEGNYTIIIRNDEIIYQTYEKNKKGESSDINYRGIS